MEYTILNTTVSKDVKLIYATEKINELISVIHKLADNQKVNEGEIKFKVETLAFVNVLQNAILSFTNALTSSVDATYTDEQIVDLIAEYNALKQRKSELLADKEINNVEAIREFQEIVARVAELKDIRDKLINAGYVPA